ncbi:energy transducer TonB [Pedobacter psychrodurus]|uniref:energy transducer TonB n=1 Tax=Pedobacter psychrodurus TaxID=2530456 RepID=UPI0029311CC9|nr:energy transducer TonB [Pedobacter psychrodurus]
MKKFILTLITLTLLINCFAQKRTTVSYFKKDMLTQNKNDYDYRRVIQETDTPSIYRLFEFYSNNQEKTIATVSKFEPNIVYEGIRESFNKQGLLTSKVNFKNGDLIGECTYYYDNGKLESIFQYDERDEKNKNSGKPSRKWVTGIDSLGNQFIKDGNGLFKKTDKKDEIEEGNYRNGYKDGIWKGTSNKGNYEEVYENGIFKSGTATLTDGKQISYDKMEVQPEFKGGMGDFYKYLGRSYKFPAEALKNRVSGKLYVTFVVERDGSLTDFSFKNNLGYGTQEEAIRVLNECPKWIPGKQHGMPVRVKYNININLAQR